MAKVRQCESTSRDSEIDHQRDGGKEESPEDERSDSDLGLFDNDWPESKEYYRA
jgi:hypothetical protein